MSLLLSLWLEGLAAGLLWIGIAFYARPLVYNFDGYMYPIEGLQPLDTMNAHHLFWIPVQALFNAVAHKVGIAPLLFSQTAGIVISGLCLMLLYVFSAQLGRSKKWSVVLLIFLALSPQYWFLTMQNLPYVPFFFFMILCVWACFSYLETRQRLPSAYAIIALAMAVQFQQAVVLLFFPLALFFIWHERTSRPARLTACFALAVLLVAGPYLLIAHIMGISTIPEFRAWVTDYLESQHSLQYRWIGLVQTVIGVMRGVVHSDAFEMRLIRSWTNASIVMLYSVIGVILLAGVCYASKRLRPAPQHRRLAWLCLGFMAAWSFFIMSWEPLMAHFWCLNLILGLLCLTMAFPQWTVALRRRVAIGLLLISVWNGYADIHQDRLEEIRNPDVWLAAIHRQVGPQDLVLFVVRDKVRRIDYDLLSQCLTRERPDGIKVLLPDNAALATLGADINAARRHGGNVWISSLVLDSRMYRNLEDAHNIFSPYPMKNLQGLDGPRIFQGVSRLLQPYAPHASPLVIGQDRFLEID